MNFLEQLKITMANLMGIDDDSPNKKMFCCKKYDPFERNDATKIQKRITWTILWLSLGPISILQCLNDRNAFTKSTTTQIRRHVQINQSCVISASLRMFHFGWIFVFFFHSISRGDFYRVVNIFKFYAFRIRSRSRKLETHTR